MSIQAGIWNFDGKPVNRDLLANFSEALSWQGPDGESVYTDDSIALLYRPFHTTEESRRERQPYVSRRGFVLTWDGRLDNRDELMIELRAVSRIYPPTPPSSRLHSIAGRPTVSAALLVIGLFPSGSRRSANSS